MAQGMVVTGVILLVIGLAAGIIFYGQSQGCETLGSDIEEIVDESAASNCGMYNILMYIGFILGIVGIVLLVMGLAAKR